MFAWFADYCLLGLLFWFGFGFAWWFCGILIVFVLFGVLRVEWICCSGVFDFMLLMRLILFAGGRLAW